MKRATNFFYKNKTNKILTIMYIIYILLYAVYMYLNPTKFNITIENEETLSIIETIIFYIIFSFVANFFVTIMYLGIVISNLTHRKQKMEIIDYSNDIIYRDIIDTYSPGELGYIDSFQLSENHIIATILNLELKGKIKIDDKITIIDNDNSTLSSNEKYVFESLINNTYLYLTLPMFEKKAKEDSEKSNLIEKSTSKSKILKCVILISIILFYIIFGVFFANREYEIRNPILQILIIPISIIISLFPFATIIYIFNKSRLNRFSPHNRSKKGGEINAKLEGLKKYIKDFSILPEREQKELKIWNEYLIYSVMFGMNNKVVEEIKRKLNV